MPALRDCIHARSRRQIAVMIELHAFGGEDLGGGTRSAEGPLSELLG